MGNAEAIADLRGVRHGYPDSVGKEMLFKDVDLVVEKGERVVSGTRVRMSCSIPPLLPLYLGSDEW